MLAVRAHRFSRDGRIEVQMGSCNYYHGIHQNQSAWGCHGNFKVAR
jgi:hypothetical protein